MLGVENNESYHKKYSLKACLQRLYEEEKPSDTFV